MSVENGGDIHPNINNSPSLLSMDLTDLVVFGIIFGLLGYAAYVYYTNAAKQEKEKEEQLAQQQQPRPVSSQPKAKPAPKNFKPEKQKKEKIPAISFGISQRIISYCITQHYLVVLCGDKAVRVIKRENYNDPKQFVSTFIPTFFPLLITCISVEPHKFKHPVAS